MSGLGLTIMNVNVRLQKYKKAVTKFAGKKEKKTAEL